MRQTHTRRQFLRCVGLGAAAATLAPRATRAAAGPAASGAPSAAREPAPPPNIVVVLCDDLGYGDLGCFGSRAIRTPVLDRMAAEGMKFTDFCCAASVCTPSRAALLTGRYPIRSRTTGIMNPGSTGGLPASELTLAEVLQSRGYATACIGKWHLGHRPEFLPPRHGFDEYFGLPYSNDMWPLNPRKKNQPPLPLIEGDKTIETIDDGAAMSRLTERYTRRAVEFIGRHKAGPFFLYLAHTMPHEPIFPAERFRGRSAAGAYGDAVEELDWSTGEILAALKQQGLDDNTLVVFTSDNGPWLNHGDQSGTAGPLRDGKFSTYEGGFRVPCLMRWPGRIPAASTCPELATTMDLLPTAAALAGAALPAGLVLDGHDLGPLLEARPGAKSPCDAFYYYAGRTLQAGRFGRWKFRELENQPELYDLQADLAEGTNLAAKQPDLVARFRRSMKDFEAAVARQEPLPSPG